MKKLLAAALLLLSIVPAVALTRAAAPAKFSIPFANGATSGFINYPIPTPSQIPFTNCLGSLTDGFPPKTMQAVSAGGCAPFGQDMNGILKQITQWNQQSQAGAAPVFDSAFASSIGGYPEGSILSQSANPSCLWVNQTDNNSNNPDTGGANWTGVCPGGGAGGTSTGSANAQVIAATPFPLQNNAVVCWTAGFTNTGSLQINVNSSGLINVLQRTPGGLTALAGGEVHVSSIYCAHYDGTQWELDISAAFASLVQPDQTLFGGANVQTFSDGTPSGTFTPDCGKGPLQFALNNGAFTLAAPTSDGACDIMFQNGASAGTITTSGFTIGANFGDTPDLVNGHLYIFHIERINSHPTFIIKNLF